MQQLKVKIGEKLAPVKKLSLLRHIKLKTQNEEKQSHYRHIRPASIEHAKRVNRNDNTTNKFTLCRYLLTGNWQDVTSKMIKTASIVR